MTEDEKLRNAFERLQEGARQAQLRWVTVNVVDKENLMMDAMGVSDDLEYYGIQLGMGAFNIYPKVGTGCLIGIIEGQETDAFLIAAEEVEEIQMRAAKAMTFNDGQLGGLVKVEALVERLNAIENDINSLKQALSGWTPVANDGGAALKTAISSYAGQKLTETERKNIENERVKQ